MHRNRVILFSFFILTILADGLIADPTITSISPLTGTGAGGTTVTILGSGFSGTTAVSFGNTSAGYTVISDREITATSPQHIPQVVSLTVTNGSEASSYYVYQGNWQVYVANSNGGTVSIIDPTSNAVVGSPITVGNNPCYIVFTPDGQTALVTNEADNTLTFIDALTQITLSPISSEGTFPNAMVLAPDGSAVYIANDNDGIISAIDLSTGDSLWTYSTGGNPSTLAITSDGAYLGVTDTATSDVIFLNTDSGTLHNQASVGVLQDCIVLDTATTTAYVTNNNNGSVSKITPYTGSSSSLITVGNNPTALVLTPDNSKLYVVNATDNTVSVINTTSSAVVDTISVGVYPKNMMIIPNGTKGYVTNSTSGTVSYINTSNEATSTISTGIGSNPYALGMLPDGSKVYVANTGSNSVSIINTTNNTVIATPSVGIFPSSIAVTPDQAPLALFSYDISDSGVTFDATDSVSPTGTIASYSWDFGDGHTDQTTVPTTSHSYGTTDTFLVTLTVTNSAGTSTQQIFNHASSRNFNQAGLAVTQSETISHNGGSTATTNQSISVTAEILPPTNLKGRSIKNKFLTQTDLVNALTWNPPQGGIDIQQYRVYRNNSLTNLAGSVSANGPLEFLDHDRKPNTVYVYYVVSVSQSGSVSTSASVEVKSK